MDEITIKIFEPPLLNLEMFDFISDSRHGAISTFIGSVRDHNVGKEVLGITYDVHEALALKILKDIALEAKKQWGKTLKIYIAHVKGHLKVGQASVLIGVSSKHRKESISACHFIIEQLKIRAPIWKQEHYRDGDSEWVKGHALCQNH